MMFLHHTGPAAPWSLVPSIKSHNSPGLCGLCKAGDWYIGTVVGVETWEEWQTFSLMVIDVDGASECCGESTPCLIYVWDSPCRALLGEYRGGRKNSLCWGWMNAVRYSENSKRCWEEQSSDLGSGVLGVETTRQLPFCRMALRHSVTVWTFTALTKWHISKPEKWLDRQWNVKVIKQRFSIQELIIFQPKCTWHEFTV